MMPFTTSLAQEPLDAVTEVSAREHVMYVVFDLVAQTFVFGIYTFLFCLSTRVLIKRKLKTRANKIMLFVTVFMYLLSTAYWAYIIVYAADLLRHKDVPQDEITHWFPMVNAVVMINFVISDCVVFWRAWVISHRRLRKYLWITLVLVALTTIAVVATIAVRAIAFIQSSTENDSSSIGTIIDILQVSTGMLTLFSNLSATTVVGLTAWRHRRALRKAFTDEDSPSQVVPILSLIVEGGAFYCLSMLILVLGALIRLPYGTIGDLYGPINLHIAGAYPPAVILLVNMKRSLNEKTFSETSSSPVDRLQFAIDMSPTTPFGGPDIMNFLEQTTSKPAPKLIATPRPKRSSVFPAAGFNPVRDVL
ncbi:hypothetical protein C8R45DRAFT_97506 [Mycena sanguinolenta]|nr:hypothetical protein C8R45DRAFT_97506 [Mycena sanguinolenta]